MKKLILAFFAFALAVFGQSAPLVSTIDGPPGGMAMEHYYSYSGSNLVYHCIAPSRQNLSTPISITAGSNAAAASLTSAAHGLNPYATPLVTISGATGAWVSLNGTWTATITGANTLTVPVNSTGFSTFTGTVVFVTRAPRLSQAVWTVQSFIYSSSLLVTSGWQGGTTSFNNVCTTPAQVQ